MPIEGPNDGNRRASRTVKLAVMGVAGMALLYSCTPAVGGVLRGWPGFGFLGNPFYRGPVAPTCGPTVPGSPQCATSGSGGSGFRSSGTSSSSSGSSTSADSSGSQSTSTRGGFGSSAAAHGSTGSGS